MNNFVKPNWFGKELDKNVFSNPKLSKLDKINELLDEETLRINKNIKNMVNKFWEK